MNNKWIIIIFLMFNQGCDHMHALSHGRLVKGLNPSIFPKRHSIFPFTNHKMELAPRSKCLVKQLIMIMQLLSFLGQCSQKGFKTIYFDMLFLWTTFGFTCSRPVHKNVASVVANNNINNNNNSSYNIAQ